jgi:hypothetical protein
MFNGTRQNIDILATGTFTVVLATGPVTYVKVKESQVTAEGAANVPQGFQYQLWINSTSTWGPLLETIPDEVMTIGDEMTSGSRHGSIVGNGPQTLGMGMPPTPATPLFRAQALTATATSLEVTQYYS